LLSPSGTNTCKPDHHPSQLPQTGRLFTLQPKKADRSRCTGRRGCHALSLPKHTRRSSRSALQSIQPLNHRLPRVGTFFFPAPGRRPAQVALRGDLGANQGMYEALGRRRCRVIRGRRGRRGGMILSKSEGRPSRARMASASASWHFAKFSSADETRIVIQEMNQLGPFCFLLFPGLFSVVSTTHQPTS